MDKCICGKEIEQGLNNLCRICGEHVCIHCQVQYTEETQLEDPHHQICVNKQEKSNE